MNPMKWALSAAGVTALVILLIAAWVLGRSTAPVGSALNAFATTSTVPVQAISAPSASPPTTVGESTTTAEVEAYLKALQAQSMRSSNQSSDLPKPPASPPATKPATTTTTTTTTTIPGGLVRKPH